MIDVADSTQAIALRLVEHAETEELTLTPTVVIAERQEHGIGRQGRDWQSPIGGLYLTWLAAGIEREVLAVLPMVAAAAAWTAVTGLGVEGVSIKWPNDLVVDGRKLGGILIQVRHGRTTWAAVGIGLNLEHAPQIAGGADRPSVAVADLLDAGPVASWREGLVGSLVEELTAGARDPETATRIWNMHLAHTPGDPLRVRTSTGPALEGRFLGVTDAGHLRLEVDGLERVIAAGDVVE